MGWNDEKAREEFAWLRLMARIKYDGYQAFHPGMRFIETLITWLQQFELADRAVAYAFVRCFLVYIGPIEMQRLVEQFYPRTVRPRLARLVAAEYGIQPYQVLADRCAYAATERLRRQTLFMGLSDGARIDRIRHANSGVLTNEQFVQVTQVDTERWRDLIDSLRRDLNDPCAKFRVVYLVDDFVGTGTSFLRYDKEREKWKGKLVRFRDSLDALSNTVKEEDLFEDEWHLCVHHYLASADAVESIEERIGAIHEELSYSWKAPAEASYGMTLPSDLPVREDGETHADFAKLTRIYYDSQIESRHTKIGGAQHLGLGYGGCGLPLVLEHNTPNNAVALLWAETDVDRERRVGAHSMRALFRRRQRHV